MGKAIKFPRISEGVQKLLDVDIDSTSQQPLYFPLPPPSPLSNFQTDNDGFSLNNKVITLSITGALNAILSKEHKLEICRYLYNHQNRDDGWGLHIEGPSTMFGTILNYVTLRFLGEGTNDGQGAMEKGRQWILDHGSATTITSWGKMWLSVQNSPLNLFVHLYNFLYFVCIMVLIIMGGDKFFVYLNGLEIIPCPLRHGCFHIFFQSTQVASPLSMDAPPKSPGTTNHGLMKKLKGFDGLAMSIGNGIADSNDGGTDPDIRALGVIFRTDMLHIIMDVMMGLIMVMSGMTTQDT